MVLIIALSFFRIDDHNGLSLLAPEGPKSVGKACIKVQTIPRLEDDLVPIVVKGQLPLEKKEKFFTPMIQESKIFFLLRREFYQDENWF